MTFLYFIVAAFGLSALFVIWTRGRWWYSIQRGYAPLYFLFGEQHDVLSFLPLPLLVNPGQL